jgi:hypothetical protein
MDIKTMVTLRLHTISGIVADIFKNIKSALSINKRKRMSQKAIYKHKKSGDLFAIETDEKGAVLSTSGPLLFKGLDPKVLDYDDYWNPDVSANIEDFERLTKDDYRDILYKNGFIRDNSQRHLF